MSTFWRERTAENVRRHGEDIIAIAAAGDAGMRFIALHYDLITMQEALAMPGGLLPILQVQPMEMYGVRWGSYLVSQAYHLARGWSEPFYPGGPDYASKVASDFGAVGSYLLNHPNPPWITGIAQGFAGFNWEAQARSGNNHPRLEPVAYLGAAATLLIAIECTEQGFVPNPVQWHTGPLRDLGPYIASRVSSVVMDELPELRVPAPFGELLRGWARGNVNLVRRPVRPGIMEVIVQRS
jgi:hypothetical protein